MVFRNIIMITILSLSSADGNASGVDVKGPKEAGRATAGDLLSTSYYLDIRERMDHLDDKICNTDKLVTEIKGQITNIESNMESRMNVLENKLENVGLKLSIEIRDQLAAYITEMKMYKVIEGKEGDSVHNLDHYRHNHKTVDVVGSLDNMTTTMESLARKTISKLENEALTLHTATSRLDDKLYSLSQKADICVRSVIDNRNENYTDSVYQGIQGTPDSSWITILRRMDGRVNFTRDWGDYKSGFGDLRAEFWLGLEDIHQLTAVRSYRLRVVLTDFSGEVKFAEYSQFFVRGEAEKYRLHVTGFVPGSTAGHSLARHNNMYFSTFDRDNDKHVKTHCAAVYKGGWWYSDCHSANPTGLYLGSASTSTTGINWVGAYNDRRSFKRLEMTIRHD